MDITFKIPLAELMDKLDLEHYHDQDGAVTIKIVGFKS
jgi:hypothetical protein